MTVPESTYRLQVDAGFDLHGVAAASAYIARLGADCLYLSPLLPSVPGSNHGYDVVGWDGIDDARGGKDGWADCLDAARRNGLKIVVDIVPNHAGVASPEDNHAWWSVLRLGRLSPYASWFDIEWSAGRILIPVLGDDFDPEQLRIEGDRLCYFEHEYPIAPGTGHGSPAEVHDRQHYELVHHRRAAEEHNYRRFFAVTELAGTRVEDPMVFASTHEQIARWVNVDGIDGLRIDHPDGLVDPLEYLERLRTLVGDEPWIIVEKILGPYEPLPAQWPVDGTTGYDALVEVDETFVDPCSAGALDAVYRTLTGDDALFGDHATAGKRHVVDTILRAEVLRLARLTPEVPRAEEALAELLVRFPVYRSYLPTGRAHLEFALRLAAEARPDLALTLSQLAGRLGDPEDELCRRFQQTSGAVMAKGVEDTAYYRYSRFIALNEVGGSPGRIGHVPMAFHQAQIRRQSGMRYSMTTLSTHDTKRGEDVRARLAVLSEVVDDWHALASHLMEAVPLTDAPFAYFLWQTLVGAGFIERSRLHQCIEKSMREANTSTDWMDPDTVFESAVHAAIDRVYDEPELRAPVQAFIDRITPYGWSNSLGQKLVQLTMPGVPDVYRGTEVWDDSLVDPDNRRPVDFAALDARLAELDRRDVPPPIDDTGDAKLWVTSRTLRVRRSRADLFRTYRPIEAFGSAAQHVVAFDRGGAVTVATRLPVQLENSGGWRDTEITLAHPAREIFTDSEWEGTVRLGDLLHHLPVALLVVS